MSADFWAGYISGAAGIIIGNPLDLIKTRLQAGDTTVQATSPQSLRSTFDKAGTLVRGTYYSFLIKFPADVSRRVCGQKNLKVTKSS
jgi:hypothetical protein